MILHIDVIVGVLELIDLLVLSAPVNVTSACSRVLRRIDINLRRLQEANILLVVMVTPVIPIPVALVINQVESSFRSLHNIDGA